MKFSPYGSNGVSSFLIRVSEKANIPALEVNAMAEKSSSGVFLLSLLWALVERKNWMEALVCGEGSTTMVGQQSGLHPLSWRR